MCFHMCSELSSQQRVGLGQDSTSQKHSHNCVTRGLLQNGPHIASAQAKPHTNDALYSYILYAHADDGLHLSTHTDYSPR